ncbi:MAG: MFS transporter [Clostridiaceae bacterium]
MNISKSFPALTHKNFRYFFIGSCISLIGTWIQNTSQSWLVLTLTNSPVKLGIVTALQFTPLLLFSLFAGAAIDRVSKKKLLIITQSTMMLLALVLAVLVFTGKIKYWHILILAALLGFVNTVDMPTRQSFVIEMVGKDDLLNGIALNSSMFNGARLIGPGIAGLLIYYLGFPLCFFLNAVSFIPLIFGIMRMKINETRILADKEMSFKSILYDIKDGIIYISRKDEIYRTVILIAIVGTFAMNYSVLIPLLAKMVLHSGSQGYGYLMSAMGAGSLISALIIAAKSKKPERSVLYISAFVISLLLLLIGFIKIYFLGILLLFLMGIFNVKFSTTANTRIQLASSNEYRGRVMSVYSLVFAGVTPIGSLFSGGISDRFGVSNAFIISAIVTAFLSIILLLTKNRSRN